MTGTDVTDGTDGTDGTAPRPTGPVARRFPWKAIVSVALVAGLAWWLFVADTAADNDLGEAGRTLWNGISDLPRLLVSTSGYRSWWRYVTEHEGIGEVLGHVVEHVQLVGLSMLLATLVSVPLGVACHRVPFLRGPLLGLASVLLTVPSLALFSIFISVSFIGVGDRGPIIALVLYSVLPILRNTLTGLEGVDRAVVESAKGVGMPPLRRLARIELPLAWPVILTGVRVATLLNIGIAAIAPLVGGTGLGGYVRNGLQGYPNVNKAEQIWTGVVFTVAVAIVADLLFTLLRRLTTSRGLRT